MDYVKMVEVAKEKVTKEFRGKMVNLLGEAEVFDYEIHGDEYYYN